MLTTKERTALPPPSKEGGLRAEVSMKDGYNGDTLHLVAYMEKRSNGWFWLEWDGQGKILFQGQPTLCTGCHSSGDDFVRGFSFP